MRSSLLVFFLLSSLIVFGQNDPFMSNGMLNPVMYNSAWTGLESGASVTFQYRNQWTGYSSSFDGSGGAPNTQMLTAMVPVVGSISGLGLTVTNDNLGPINTLYINVPVAYNIQVSRSTISFGLMPGVVSRTQNFNELRFIDPSDPFNVGSKETQTLFNLGAGVIYSTPTKTYVGISAVNMLNPNFNFGLDDAENNISPSVNLIAGLTKRISKNFDFAPNIVIRSDLNSFTFDLGSFLYYQEKGWAGVSYRWDEAIVAMVGYSFLQGNKLRVGYAVDIVIDENNAKSGTSQEILLRYNLPEFLLGGKKKVKTPRFIH